MHSAVAWTLVTTHLPLPPPPCRSVPPPSVDSPPPRVPRSTRQIRRSPAARRPRARRWKRRSSNVWPPVGGRVSKISNKLVGEFKRNQDLRTMYACHTHHITLARLACREHNSMEHDWHGSQFTVAVAVARGESPPPTNDRRPFPREKCLSCRSC